MPRAEKTSRRSRLSTDERRAQLLELAVQLFSDRTYEEISIDDIAAAAGVSKGLLYHYFSGKRAFYVAAVRHAAEQLLADTEPADDAPPRGMPDEADLRRGIDAYLSFVERRRVAFSFLLRGGMGGDPEVREIVEDTRHRILGRMLEGLGRREDDARLRIALRGFLGFAEAASLDWLERGDLDKGELAEMLMQACISIVTPALSAPSS